MPPRALFLNKVRRTVEKFALLKKGERLVVGVSGGPDSLALLYSLYALRKEYRLSLFVAHLNHGLRGKESREDMDFVTALAGKLGLAINLRELPAGSLAGGSVEEKARKARLEFLFDAAGKNKARKIALGHNLDDQAETVLMRLLRGSGLLGLSGILPRKKMGDFIIIRPLLEVKRQEIERFLKLKKIIPRRDSTNSQEAYFRNRIRHKLLPDLEKYNLKVKEILANTAEGLALDYDYLSELSQRKLKGLMQKKSGSRILLPRERFLKMHPGLQNMILRLVFAQIKGDTRRLTYKHIQELKDLIYTRPSGAIVDLPSGISFSKKPTHICAYIR